MIREGSRARCVLFSALTLLALLLTSCGTPATPTSAPPTSAAPTSAPPTSVPATSAPAATTAPVTITWFEHLSTEWGNEWFDKVTTDFEAKTGIHVQRISAPWADLWPKMTTWSQSGDMPDVFGTWAGWNIDLAGWGVLPDLAPVIQKLPDPQKFAADQGALWPDIGTSGGKIVAVPWWVQPYGLVYNKEAFAQHGYQVPKTWDDLRALLVQMKKDGVGGMEMTWGLPAEGNHFLMLHWGWWLADAGGSIANDQGKPGFQTPEGKAAVQYWYDLYKDGLLYKGSEAASVQQNRGDFCSGKTLMIIDGIFMGATCKTMGAKFTPTLAPPLCGAKSCGSIIQVWYLTIPSTTKHPVEALRFIDYITSDAVSQEFSTKFQTAVANPIIYTSDAFKADPMTGAVQGILAAKGNQGLPAISHPDTVWTMASEEWQAVLFGKQTIDQMMTNINTKWLQITSK